MTDEYEEVTYMREDVLLLVESVDGSMVITHANMDITNLYHLTTYLVEQMSKRTGVSYNETCDDIKEIEDDKDM